VKPRRIAIGLGALALLAALAYAFYWPPGNRELSLPAGQSLDVAQLEQLAPLPAFALQRQGPALTPADLLGRWSFVYFGYTNCPDACPTTLGMLSHVQEELQSQGQEPPRIVFISLDPQRDTPELLQRYCAAFGPDTTGATGSDAALQGLISFFGITYERKDQTDKTNYTVDHTTNFFLLTPDGRWLATFAPADDAEAVLQDTLTLMRMPLP